MTKTLNRREFITRTVAAGAGATALLGCADKPAANGAASAPGAVPSPASAEKPLVTRALGKTGIVLPIVNMGVMNADNPDLVRRAYELGMRHFDTAAGYWRGKNEEMVGKVLGELGARPQAVIATKVNIPPAQRDSLPAADLKAAFVKAFEGSLRRLRTDYVDILYVHDVSRIEDVRRPGFMEALAELKDQKKIRFAGFSCHQNMAACLDEASGLGLYEVLLIAYNYAMQDDLRLEKSIAAAAARGTGLVAMKTQCMQSWYRDEMQADRQAFYSGAIVQTAVLKWALRNEAFACAVPGFTNFRELDEDISVARDLALTDKEKTFLADRKIRLAMAHCVQCGGCRGTCPAGVDTPALMRAHMYLRYPNVSQVRETLVGLPAGRGLDGCDSCAACVARCRGRIDIGRRIAQLKLHLA
jgi:aryl-alcohol dehydrogenase-like predicted oxidoreductase